MGGSSEHKPLTDIQVNAIVAIASFSGRVGTRHLLPGMQHFNTAMMVILTNTTCPNQHCM